MITQRCKPVEQFAWPDARATTGAAGIHDRGDARLVQQERDRFGCIRNQACRKSRAFADIADNRQ